MYRPSYTKPIEAISSFEEFKERAKKEKLASLRRRKSKENPGEVSSGYNPDKEKPYGHPLHLLPVEKIQDKISEALRLLSSEVSSQIVNTQEVLAFRKSISHCQKGPERGRTTFAFVGEQGVGKSTSINALLHRSVLADSQKANRACTQYPTIFEHKPRAADNTDESDVTISLLDVDKLTPILEEHIRNWSYMHCTVPEQAQSCDENELDDAMEEEEGEEDHTEDDDVSSDREVYTTAPDQTKLTRTETVNATTAMELFQNIFQCDKYPESQKELKEILNGVNVNNGTFLHRCLQKIEQLKHEAQAEGNDIHCKNVKDSDFKRVANLAKRLACIVDRVVVSTGAAILRAGVVLIDLPGFGDLDQTRMAFANTVRRQSDFEIIVTPINRVLTRKEVNRYIENALKAHGGRNTIILFNQIDREIPEDIPMDTLIGEVKEDPFPEICQRIQEIGDRKYEEGDEETELEHIDYVRDLERQAGCAYAHLQVELTGWELKEKHTHRGGGDIRLAGITAIQYMLQMNVGRPTCPKFSPEMTGIPSFRNVLHNIVAEKTYCNLQRRRIISKQKEDDGFYSLRQKFTALLKEFNSNIDICVSGSLESALPHMWDFGTRSCVMAKLEKNVASWSKGIHAGTYRMAIRQRGIPEDSKAKAYVGRYINWNLDLLSAMESIVMEKKSKRPNVGETRKPLLEWKNRVIELSSSMTARVISLIHSFLDNVQKSMDKTSCDERLKRRTRDAWQKVVATIREIIHRLPSELEHKVNDVFRAITTEEDIGCMIASLNTAQYEKIVTLKRGRGIYGRHKTAIRKAFLEMDKNGKTFIDRYEDEAAHLMRCALGSALNDFRQTINARFQEFTAITQQFLESQDHKTKEYRALRSRLEVQMPIFESHLLELQRMFPGYADQAEIEERPFAKRIKLQYN